MKSKTTMSTYEKISGGTSGRYKKTATPRLNKSNSTGKKVATKLVRKGSATPTKTITNTNTRLNANKKLY